LGILEDRREQLLGAARLMFVFGVVVGFVVPLYLALDRLYFLNLFASTLPSFFFQVTFSLVASILCLVCHWNIRNGRFGSASLRGVVAAALLVTSGVWLASVVVLAAAIICSLCKTTSA